MIELEIQYEQKKRLIFEEMSSAKHNKLCNAERVEKTTEEGEEA